MFGDAKYRQWPLANTVCHCPAFPWPHALLLSQRCCEQSYLEDARDERTAWDAEWAEEARLDARERAEAANAAR